MNDLYFDPQSNQPRSVQAFNHAVLAIIHGDEGKTAGALNEAKRQLKAEGQPSRWLDGFYGDYGSKNQTPWIKCPQHMAIVARTVAGMGDEEHIRAFNRFAKKTGEFYKTSYALLHSPAPRRADVSTQMVLKAA